MIKERTVHSGFIDFFALVKQSLNHNSSPTPCTLFFKVIQPVVILRIILHKLSGMEGAAE